MTAFNVVRFRVKPGREQDFVDAHKIDDPGFIGMQRFSLIDTGNGTYCVVGEWESFASIVAARPGMIGMLDNVRDMLEDLGDGLGVTDPISGSLILEMRPPAPKRRTSVGKKKAKAAPKRKPAAKKAAKKGARKPAKKAAKRGRKK